MVEVKTKTIVREKRIQVAKKKCQQCGKDFWGERLKIYCSKACANRAVYWRRPEHYRQYRQERYRSQKERVAKKS